MRRQRDRFESYIAKGVPDGATLAAGGGRTKDLDRGWYIEPTVFGNVDNSSAIAQDEIFGPVLSVISAADERDAVAIADDTIYGLNASVFTNDVDRTREVAGQLRSGTVGHNNFRTDFGIAFGGFKQSGIDREGGVEGLLPFLETKTVILEGRPGGYAASTERGQAAQHLVGVCADSGCATRATSGAWRCDLQIRVRWHIIPERACDRSSDARQRDRHLTGLAVGEHRRDCRCGE
jgi:delta 1-pyrroline-5-carboxylate dehydrogenase